jgi:small subunit ribosomal protein S2
VAQVGIAELLEAGVHFGHQTRRWNPKMRRFIYGERGGNYIIDLVKTSALLEQAQAFANELSHRGGTVLFVGTKKQARDTVREVAESADMPFVNHRWLGGLLTNFQTISLRIRRLHDLERYANEGQLELLPTRERMAAQADLEKLRANLGGVKDMQRVPDAVFVIDLKTELIAVKEAQRLRIPIIGLVDTNCDPDGIDFVIPGNDDAIRSCALITQAIGQVVAEGHSVFRAEEERARKEAEEKARIEAEARAKREAEEQAKREAEEQAKKAAEEKAAAEQAAAALQQQPAAAAPAAATTAAPAAAQAPPAAAGAPSQDAPAPAAAKAPDAPAKAPAEKATAEKAAAAAAAEQPAPETTPVSAAPADPDTLEPQTESVTPMNASPDSSQPAKEQSAPPETAAESEAEAPEAPAAEAPAAEEPAQTAEAAAESDAPDQPEQPAKEAQTQ